MPPPPGQYGGPAQGQYGGAQVYAPAGAGAPVQPRPDLGAAVSFGWDRFSQNLGPHLVATLVLFGATLIGYAIMAVILFAASETITIGGETIVVSNPGLIPTLLATVIVIAATLFGSFPLRNSALQEASGTPPTIGSAFQSKNLGAFMLVSLVILVAQSLLSLIPIFGWLAAVVVNIFFWFAPFVALQYGSDPIKSMQRSAEMTTKNMNWLYLIVCALLAAVGVIACGIGVLASIPIAMLAAAFLYKGTDLQMPMSA